MRIDHTRPFLNLGQCLSAETGNKRFKTAITGRASTSQQNLYLNIAFALADSIYSFLIYEAPPRLSMPLIVNALGATRCCFTFRRMYLS